MKPRAIFEEFELIAKKMGIQIIQGKGNFNGGYCLLEEERIIVINKLKPMEQRIRALSQVFAKMDTSKIYLKPIVRKMIESEEDTLQLSLIK